MHALAVAAAHLVPVVARQLQLGTLRHLELGERHEIVEACLACGLLLDEPGHGRPIGPFGKPGEQAVVLAGAAVLQRLVPRDERIGPGRQAGQQRLHRGTFAFDELSFEQPQAGLVLDLGTPVRPASVGVRRVRPKADSCAMQLGFRSRCSVSKARIAVMLTFPSRP